MQNSNPDCAKWASHFMSMSHGNCKKWKDKITKVQSINNLQSVDIVIPPQQKVSGAKPNNDKVLMKKDAKVKKHKSIKKRKAKGDPNNSTKRVRPSKKAFKTSTTNKRRRDRLD